MKRRGATQLWIKPWTASSWWHLKMNQINHHHHKSSLKRLIERLSQLQINQGRSPSRRLTCPNKLTISNNLIYCSLTLLVYQWVPSLKTGKPSIFPQMGGTARSLNRLKRSFMRGPLKAILHIERQESPGVLWRNLSWKVASKIWKSPLSNPSYRDMISFPLVLPHLRANGSQFWFKTWRKLNILWDNQRLNHLYHRKSN